MTIIQAGLYRSGTTWQFNALRIMLNQAFENDVYSCFWGQYDRTKRKKINLIKTHKFNDSMSKNADFIFTTFRTDHEVKASMMRRNQISTDQRFSNESNVMRFNEFKSHAVKWASVADEITAFDHIIENPLSALDRYASILKISVDLERVLTELNSLKAPAADYDPVTLLHANHRTK